MCNAQAQRYCGQNIPAFFGSINHKGITLEVGSVAQDSKFGFVFGILVSSKMEEQVEYKWVEGEGMKEIPNGNTYRVISGDLHMYGSYRLATTENHWSAHLLGGAVFDIHDGLYPSGGFEIRKVLINQADESRNKCLFFRGLYPGNYNIGIILRL